MIEMLRKIPEDVFLAIASRPIASGDARTCVLGWAAREIKVRELSFVDNVIDAENVYVGGPIAFWEERLPYDEFSPVFAATDGEDEAELEEAFVDRLNEIVDA